MGSAVSLRTVSYGGGVQSTALLVLAAKGEIDFPTFLFANVGDDSENPATLRYVREIAAPYAKANGIELLELRRQLRAGGTRTLLEELRGQERSIPIPARMGAGGFGQKKCTERFKIRVVRRELRQRGASAEDPATVAIGISVDEIERAKTPGLDPRDPTRHVVYPLLTLHLRRSDCTRIIASAGLPIPSKSACSFCPMHDAETWRAQRRDDPERWALSVEIDALIRTRAITLGRGAMGLVHPTIPLAEIVDDSQGVLAGMDGCDSGWCMT